MRKATYFILNIEERQAIQELLAAINCSCECQDHEPCPFLMKNDGCIIRVLADIADKQKKLDF